MKKSKKLNDKLDVHQECQKLKAKMETQVSRIPFLELQLSESRQRETAARVALTKMDSIRISEEEQLKEMRKEVHRLKEDNCRLAEGIHDLKKEFGEVVQKKDQLIRVLNDEVVDLRGQIRVAIRVRHFNTEKPTFQITSRNEVKFQNNQQSNTFTFEHIFRPTTGQADVSDDVQELILCALHGKNVSLIAYGPTSSGKTYTMRGGDGEEKNGVIPRAIHFILKHSNGDLSLIGWEYNFSASFVEVYNEEVFDLLDKDRKKLDVRVVGDSTIVSGLNKVEITDMTDVDHLLKLADSRRSVAATSCNLHSSRSHAVFQVFIEGANTSGETLKCCLNLVDLAGSERVKESGAQGKQFTELTNINQSLSTLKNCIRAQMNKMTHIPYRESKLTVLLREYLGAGSSKTMFIAHVSPDDVSETKRTLEFTADLRSTRLGKATIQTGQSKKT